MKLKPIKGLILDQLYVENPPDRLREELEKLFTFKNPAYELAAKFSPWGPPKLMPQFIYLTAEVNGVLSVPRGIDPEQLSLSSKAQWRRIKWEDKRTRNVVNFPKLRIPLNQEQTLILKDFQNAINDRRRPFGNFLYVLYTSAGKTGLQSFLARFTAQRTLVLCCTNLIKKAWHDDLLKFYGLKKRDVGIIQQNEWRIGEQFTLASVQTLARRKNLWPELNRQIGCCIVDEAQIAKSPSVYEFIQNCTAKYILGSTATPKENNFMLYSLLGNPRKRLVSEQRETQTSLPLKFVQEITTPFFYSHDPSMLDWHDLMETISMDEKRNMVIVRECLKQWKTGESLLIVSRRVPHVHLLAEMLKEAGIDDVNVITGGTNSDVEYTRQLVGGILSKDIRCIVATVPAITLGANLNPVSRLHLAMPLKDGDTLEQLIGRIRRRSQGKSPPGLIVYLDKNVDYLHSIYKRYATPVFRKLKVPGFKNTYIA